MSRLPLCFYQREDVVQIAKDLLGKWLFSQTDNDPVTGGIIIETETYGGIEDRACHAFGNRRTKRTEVMYQGGGVAYIYLCYGIHCLLNVVSHKQDVPHAILIRAIIPKIGIETMLLRRKKEKQDASLTKGPGSVCQALNIALRHNAVSLSQPPIWIEDRGIVIPSHQIEASPRIGVGYAQEHALLPWRFSVPSDLFS